MNRTGTHFILWRSQLTGPAESQTHRSSSLRFNVLWVAVLALLMTGCASMGPSTIGRDRIDYDHAVTESWQRQLLVNLVKLRYNDTPFFLDVG